MISIIQMGKYMHRNNIVSVYQNNTTTFPRSRTFEYVIEVWIVLLFPMLHLDYFTLPPLKYILQLEISTSRRRRAHDVNE